MKATKEQAQFFKPFVDALAEGKIVEKRRKGCGSNTWEKCSEDIDWFNSCDIECFDFRIVEPKRLRPWVGPWEVPHGIRVRRKDHPEDGWLLIVQCFAAGVVLGDYRQHNYKDLLDHSEWDRGDNNWKPCGVLSELEKEKE